MFARAVEDAWMTVVLHGMQSFSKKALSENGASVAVRVMIGVQGTQDSYGMRSTALCQL